MRTYLILGFLILGAFLAGCSSSSETRSEPPKAPAETQQADVPVGTGLEPSSSTTTYAGEAPTSQVPDEQEPPTGEADTAETDQSIGNLFGSVGRVLFGGSDDGNEGAETDEDERSVMSSVGRALTKGAVEAAQQEPEDE